ncbi:unnamed protein product, partial [Trichobilharzia szidati]
TNMKMNTADATMARNYTSNKNLKRGHLVGQPFSVKQVIWLAADITWMVLITVTIVILLSSIPKLREFLMKPEFVKYFFL